MADVFISIKDLEFSETKWVDTRFSLQDAEAGKQKYKEGHVTGAVYWDLEDDLSDMTKFDGRHPLPEKAALTELFRKSGLSTGDHIVVYDDGGSPFAPRAWWLLQYAGFKNSFIALEGFDAIKEAGFPIDDSIPKPVKTSVTPGWDETIHATRQFVEETVAGETAGILLDARSAERYKGEHEPIDSIAGRIPGALNFDWERLKIDGSFNLDEGIKEQLYDIINPAEEVTVYCGSGVTAVPLYAMLKQQGYEKVRLYVGSYSDWISKDDADVERG